MGLQNLLDTFDLRFRFFSKKVNKKINNDKPLIWEGWAEYAPKAKTHLGMARKSVVSWCQFLIRQSIFAGPKVLPAYI